MLAADLPYEVGDRVERTTPWGEVEYATVVAIPDGATVNEVEVVTEDDEAYGTYSPEDWQPAVH